MYNLIGETEDAFNMGHPVLTAFGFFNLRNLPDTTPELPEYRKV